MRLCWIILFIALAPVTGFGGVNPKNGNFFITYQDIPPVTSDAHALELRRTYNSKSAHQGWIGYGWNTLFETYLVVLPDGSGVVRENGGGFDTFYRNPNLEEVRRGARRLAQAELKPEQIGKADEETLYIKLLNDENMRAMSTERQGMRSEIPLGRVLKGGLCTQGSLRATGADYRRRGCEGETDVFDLNGQLLHRDFDDGYQLNLVRTDGRVTEVRDNRGHFLELRWSGSGQLERVLSSNKKQASFKQDAQNNLAESEDWRGNRYKYQYDERHNLSRIEYADTSYLAIEYVSPDSAMVKRVKERNGSYTEYEYGAEPQSSLHYWTRMSSVNVDGLRTSRTIEYQDAESPAGAQYAKSVIREGDSRRISTRLDARGRLIERLTSDGRLTRFEYDDSCNKLSRVTTIENGETDFTYGAKCDLERVVSRDGQDIRLNYDLQENVKRIWSRSNDRSSPKERLIK